MGVGGLGTILERSVGNVMRRLYMVICEALGGNILCLDGLRNVNVVFDGRLLLDHLIESRALGIRLIVGSGRRRRLLKRALSRGSCDGG